MKFKLIFVLVFALFFVKAYSQSDAVKGSDPSKKQQDFLTYKLTPNYGVNVSHKYLFSENTTISRVLSDNSTSTYSRKLDYFTSLRAHSQPKDGIYYLVCGIDSMRYEYTDGIVNVKYDSQDDDAVPPFKYFDFEKNMVIQNKEFELKMSSYNEPISLKSEQIDEIFTNIRDEIKGIKDTLKRFTWENALTFDNLKFFADVNKGITPDKKVAIDSSWIDIVHLMIDGVPYRDSVFFKIENYNTKFFTITGKSLKLKALPSKARFQGINRIVETVSGSGNVDYKMHFTNRGQVELLEINIDAKYTGRIGQEEFTHNIKTTYNWKFDKSYKW